MSRKPATGAHFGLTARALKFARLYGEHPCWGVTLCAKEAGYSDTGQAAHVRGCELLRDPRVIHAIVHFGSLAFNDALATASARLRLLAEGGGYMTVQDRTQVSNLEIDVWDLKRRTDRLDAIYGAASPALAQ